MVTTSQQAPLAERLNDESAHEGETVAMIMVRWNADRKEAAARITELEDESEQLHLAIRERSPAQGAAADVIRRLRTPDEFNNRGPSYEPMVIQPSTLRLEAADALEEAAAKITELEGENEQLRLAICGGEDAPGYAASLPLATILQVQANNARAWRDRAERAEAQCRVLSGALEPFARAFDAFNDGDELVTAASWRAIRESTSINDFRQASVALSPKVKNNEPAKRD